MCNKGVWQQMNMHTCVTRSLMSSVYVCLHRVKSALQTTKHSGGSVDMIWWWLYSLTRLEYCIDVCAYWLLCLRNSFNDSLTNIVLTRITSTYLTRTVIFVRQGLRMTDTHTVYSKRFIACRIAHICLYIRVYWYVIAQTLIVTRYKRMRSR